MTVGELIVLLQAYPPGQEVKIETPDYSSEGQGYPTIAAPVKVRQQEFDGVVVTACE